MKRLQFFLNTFLCAMALQAQELVSVLHLQTTQGAVYDFVLRDQQPEVLCYNGYMTVTYDGGAGCLTFAREDVSKLTIEQRDVTPVTDVAATGRHVSFDLTARGRVRVRGLKDSEIVHAYSADGKTIASVRCHNGEASLDLTAQPRGVYVIKAGDGRDTFKMLKP